MKEDKWRKRRNEIDKATGTDGVTAVLDKSLQDKLVPALLNIFNWLLQIRYGTEIIYWTSER